MRLIAVLAAGLLLPCLPVQAQTWYQIEVILFRQDVAVAMAANTTAETWAEDLDLAWRSPLLDLYESDNSASPALRKLPVSSRKMNPDAVALRITPGYQVLWHQAWQQPLSEDAEVPWIRVQGGQRIGPRFELEGSMNVRLSRFLHFSGEFWLSDDSGGNSASGFSLTQLPVTPQVFDACTLLRLQPFDAAEPAHQDGLPAGWTHPYGCESPRTKAGVNAPRTAAQSPQTPRLAQELMYEIGDSGEVVRALVETTPPALDALEFWDMLEPVEEVQLDYPLARIAHVAMDRRLRSTEYHYIDHPLLAALVLVTEAPTPEPVTE